MFKLIPPDKSNDAQNSSLLTISWNIEGLARNVYNLDHFLCEFKPSLVFLSEPQVFQCDIDRLMIPFNGKYKFVLNSKDSHDLDLPMEKLKAKGGTMAMWDTKIDQHVTVLKTNSPSVLALLVKLPGHVPACHIGVYMPTAGLEDQFLEALSELDTVITDLLDRFGDDTPIFVRGDMNVSERNIARTPLLSHLRAKHGLKSACLQHPSYHHFIGDGEFDSTLDVLLYSQQVGVKETLLKQVCKHQHPLVYSHHDLLLSKSLLPIVSKPNVSAAPLAPKVQNERAKIKWSETGISDYQSAIGTGLDDLASRWCNPESPTNISILLSATYSLLHIAATSTNKFVDLSKEFKPKPFIQPHIASLRKAVLTIHKEKCALMSSCSPDPAALDSVLDRLTAARSLYARTLREVQQKDQDSSDQLLSELLASDPSKVHQAIKKSKSASSAISTLKVGSKIFTGDNICDGFFESLSSLKEPDMAPIHESPSFQETLRDYRHVIELAKSGEAIPDIDVHESVELLYSVKQEVNDLFSVTASHFINAGAAGLRHFHLLMSTLIANLNNASLSEMNDIWAMVLYKGHNKDKESDRSYRTISTCPLLAKCLDIYIGRRYYSEWRLAQAPTQFQGEGSSHDLASLLLTETVQHSLFKGKEPIFALFLDAKSAFDVVIRQNAIVAAFKAGTRDQGLLYLDARMANRRTFPQWGTTLMGPICDRLGVEQGAINSDRIYKLCNNSQLVEGQNSGLGVDLDGVHVAAIGQADDVVLLANSPIKLACLLYLTILYCQRQHVTLVPEKTKLLVWSPTNQKQATELLKLSCPISIKDNQIEYCSSAEHVGVLRSTDGGNMPHILDRVSAHRRAMASILHTGSARHHRSNPAASIQLERLYGCPVLLSGLASLVLSNKEMSAVLRHHRVTLCRLQKLAKTTPDCVVYFLAGSLPSTALIHIRQLGLLGMLARLGENSILHQIGRKVLLSTVKSRSWFLQVRTISQQYDLPDPLLILQSPPAKETWKKLTKAKVTSWWEERLRGEASLLSSLTYFRPAYMSLNSPHPLWTMAESPFEVKKASIVADMLSGRYVTDYRARHWSSSNPNGYCQLCLVTGHIAVLGTLEHLLLKCPALADTRRKSVSHWSNYLVDKPSLLPIVKHHTLTPGHEGTKLQMELLLDPSTCPMVISSSQSLGKGTLSHLLYMTRTWCHSHHLKRRRMLKLYNII